jgi:putative transposase
MARKLRIQYPGAIYHVMNRGDRREAIFLDDKDRVRFLDTLAEGCAKTDWQVHAYCVMGNHFHLVVETPVPNLADGMKWLLQTYTSRFNRRHKNFGHLFSGRYKAPLVEGSGNGYLRTVCEYVHLNPVRAKLIRPEHSLRAFAWSSYSGYLSAERAPWLRVDRVMGEYGIPGDTLAGRQRFEEVMEQRRLQADDADWKPLRRGWCIGSEQFRKELLEQVTKRIGPNHFGEERRESAEQKAIRILGEELARLGLSAELLPTATAARVRIARRLRTETTMSLKWIADNLRFDSWKYLSNLLNPAIATNDAQPTLGL